MYYVLNSATRITWSRPNTLIVGAPPGAHCVIRGVPDAARGLLLRLALPATRAVLQDLWLPLESVTIDEMLEALQWAGAIEVLTADSPSQLAVQSRQQFGIVGLDTIGVLLAEQLAASEPRSLALSDTRQRGVYWPAVHGLREARTGTERARDLAYRIRSYGIPTKVYRGEPPPADVYALCGDNMVDADQALPLHQSGQAYLNVRYGRTYALIGPLTNPSDPDSPCATCDMLWRSPTPTDDWLSGETFSLLSLRGSQRAAATSYHAFRRLTEYENHLRTGTKMPSSPDNVLVLDTDGHIAGEYKVVAHPECWCAARREDPTPVCNVVAHGG